MTLFSRYVGIDYSGAETADSRLPGLRVFVADSDGEPRELRPGSDVRKHWTRRGTAEWLRGTLAEEIRTIVGIDHGFSFPVAYFEKYSLERRWPQFLHDFQAHWPTDEPSTYVDFIREGVCGNGAARTGDPRWLRLTEQWTATAKSVFLFDVQGSVAKSTHTGVPWLRYLRQTGEGKIHFWPFDGWVIPDGTSVIAEVYPTLWMKRFPKDGRDNDSHAAYAAAAWLKWVDSNGYLPRYLKPPLNEEEQEVAAIEGWILGVV